MTEKNERGPVAPPLGRPVAAAHRRDQGFISQPVTGNRRAPVLVYRTGLTGYRSEPVEFKSKFKSSRATGLPAGLTGLPGGLTGLTGGP